MDASQTGLGGVLFHLPDGTKPGDEYNQRKHWDGLEIIMFISFRLTDAQTRLTNPEREMLAVVEGLKETKWMTMGSPFPIKIYTDHL